MTPLLTLQGYYCPDATTILPCPEGKFCKWWSRRPKSCPWLATCPHGSTSADLSLAGFFFMLLILLLLWLAYVACDAYIRWVRSLVPALHLLRLCCCIAEGMYEWLLGSCLCIAIGGCVPTSNHVYTQCMCPLAPCLKPVHVQAHTVWHRVLYWLEHA